MFILKRYIKFYKSKGLSATILRIFTTPLRIINKNIYNRNKKEIFSKKTKSEKFELIYKNNFWSSNESVSGLGSEKKNTVKIRSEIINIINKYNVKKILDVPCGDFNWIKDILNDKINYLGGDIVNDLIDQNIQKYKKKNINFTKLDITSDILPNADLLICRDCLIHLSFDSINMFFENFKKSNIDLLLLTSYKLKDRTKKIVNSDIPDGEFREIDLSEEPFNLPEPVHKILDKDDQTKSSGYYCYLNLYSKKQIDNLFN